MCVLTPLAVAWVIVRLPADYFVSERRGKSMLWEKRPVLRAIAVVAKNVAGAVLILAGVSMLVGPGQGLLTIFVGLMLVNFPGKYRLERWLATQPAVWRSITWLRKKARREPLQRPGAPA
jgi:hypothetical protein